MSEYETPIALAAYELLADGYDAKAETKAENGFNEHPAMRACVGDVTGLAVLDAGCGPGFLARDLLAAGATRLVALDVSPRMIELAKLKTGGAAECHVSDLAKPLGLDDDSFDLVVSSLAMDYVRDWSVPLGSFRRILKPDGRLVMSVQHPMGSYDWFKPPSAFGVHLCEATWRGFTDQPVVVPDFYRSFEELINPVIAAGFRIQRLHETRPVPALRALDRRKFERGNSFPTFMIIDAIVSTEDSGPA